MARPAKKLYRIRPEFRERIERSSVGWTGYFENMKQAEQGESINIDTGRKAFSEEGVSIRSFKIFCDQFADYFESTMNYEDFTPDALTEDLQGKRAGSWWCERKAVEVIAEPTTAPEEIGLPDCSDKITNVYVFQNSSGLESNRFTGVLLRLLVVAGIGAFILSLGQLAVFWCYAALVTLFAYIPIYQAGVIRHLRDDEIRARIQHFAGVRQKARLRYSTPGRTLDQSLDGLSRILRVWMPSLGRWQSVGLSWGSVILAVALCMYIDQGKAFDVLTAWSFIMASATFCLLFAVPGLLAYQIAFLIQRRKWSTGARTLAVGIILVGLYIVMWCLTSGFILTFERNEFKERGVFMAIALSLLSPILAINAKEYWEAAASGICFFWALLPLNAAFVSWMGNGVLRLTIKWDLDHRFFSTLDDAAKPGVNVDEQRKLLTALENESVDPFRIALIFSWLLWAGLSEFWKDSDPTE